ncbi:MAG: DedA family protein [Candidatus Pacebacteria bacterium]|nr:DedA family protein [Candidatus Paceibacterota bacterium]MDR3583578.1 DedA family protein [Candidatus Paceibacterota bacterium]
MTGKILSLLAGFIIGGISTLGYSGVALMMAIESMCVPLPSEIIMPFSGYLVSQGQFTLLGITLAGAVGSLIGSVAAYWVGWWLEKDYLLKYGKYIFITHHDLDAAEKFFGRYGDAAIFFSRMLPVVRTFISLPAGISRMNFKKFAAYTFLGSLPWCLALGYAGQKMGDNWDTLGAYFHKFDAIIGILIIIGAAWFLERHFGMIKRRFGIKK